MVAHGDPPVSIPWELARARGMGAPALPAEIATANATAPIVRKGTATFLQRRTLSARVDAVSLGVDGRCVSDST